MLDGERTSNVHECPGSGDETKRPFPFLCFFSIEASSSQTLRIEGSCAIIKQDRRLVSSYAVITTLWTCTRYRRKRALGRPIMANEGEAAIFQSDFESFVPVGQGIIRVEFSAYPFRVDRTRLSPVAR